MSILLLIAWWIGLVAISNPILSAILIISLLFIWEFLLFLHREYISQLHITFFDKEMRLRYQKININQLIFIKETIESKIKKLECENVRN